MPLHVFTQDQDLMHCHVMQIHAPVQLDQVEKELKKLQQQQQHQGQSGPAVGSVS